MFLVVNISQRNQLKYIPVCVYLHMLCFKKILQLISVTNDKLLINVTANKSWLTVRYISYMWLEAEARPKAIQFQISLQTAWTWINKNVHFFLDNPVKSSNCISLWKQKISIGKEPSGKYPVYVKPAFTVYNLNDDEEEHQTEISNIRFQQKGISNFQVFDIASQSDSSHSSSRRLNGTKLRLLW